MCLIRCITFASTNVQFLILFWHLLFLYIKLEYLKAQLKSEATLKGEYVKSIDQLKKDKEELDKFHKERRQKLEETKNVKIANAAEKVWSVSLLFYARLTLHFRTLPDAGRNHTTEQ